MYTRNMKNKLVFKIRIMQQIQQKFVNGNLCSKKFIVKAEKNFKFQRKMNDISMFC